MFNRIPYKAILCRELSWKSALKTAALFLSLLATCEMGFSQESFSPAGKAQAENPAKLKPSSSEKSTAETTDSETSRGGSSKAGLKQDVKVADQKSSAVKLFNDVRFGPDGEYLLKIDGDTRFRAEYRDNYDFDDSKDDSNPRPQYLRSRLRYDLTYCELTRVFLELSDSREWNRQEGDANQHNPADIQQAYVELKQPDKGPWSVRLGRQEMLLGRDKRLVDASSWSNLRNRFLGGRATYSTEKLDLELFLTHPENFRYKHNGRTRTGRGRPSDDEYFYGAYMTSRHLAEHTIEAYFLGLSDTNNHRTFPSRVKSEDGTFGSTDRFTVGSAMYGPLAKTKQGELTYTVDGAYQFGRLSKDDIQAYFLRGDIKHEWKKHQWKPSLALVSTLASGDRDPNDGRAGTFDNLFGSGHNPYGIMDIVSARNLRELAIVGNVQPTKKLSLQAEAHSYWADSKTDTALRPPGAASLRDKSGGSGRRLGQEISLVAKYKLTDNMTLESGAAHFFSGSYGDNLGAGDDANFFYLQTEIKF